MSVSVECRRLGKPMRDGTVAFCSVRVAGFGTVHEVRVVEDRDGTLSVEGPKARAYPQDRAAVSLENGVREAVVAAVLEEFAKEPRQAAESRF